MSRNKANKAQNRGKRRRLSTKNIDNLCQSVDALKAEMGIGTEPVPPYEEPRHGGTFQFGLTEAMMGFALIATAAIINWHVIFS